MTDRPPLDLTQVEIRRLSSETRTNIFCCDKRPINRFLKNKAKISDDRWEMRTFCAHLGTSVNCIGYYTLQLGSDSVTEFEGAKSKYIQNYVAFPAVHLKFLGVDERYQRQGLGSHLLMDVFTKVAEISKHAGFFALTLQSYDTDSTAFYRSIGFAPYSENVAQPKMLYPLESILELVTSAQERG